MIGKDTMSSILEERKYGFSQSSRENPWNKRQNKHTCQWGRVNAQIQTLEEGVTTKHKARR